MTPFRSPTSLEPLRPAGADDSRLLLALVGALFLLLAWPLLTGRMYVGNDLGAFHLPARAFYAECLRQGDAFDWWPQLFGGFYLTGEGQAGVYHPWHWLLYRTLLLDLAFGLEVFSVYPFAFIGNYLLLRPRVERRDFALWGAACATFSGFMLLHLVHVNAVAVMAHTPWLLWAIDRWSKGTSRARTSALLIALLTASQLLLGYPQYVLFSIGLEALFALYLAWERPRDRRVRTIARLLAMAGAKSLGLLLAAVQLLPTFEALGESTRQSASTSFTQIGSLHPLNLVQLVAPYLFASRVVGQNTHELGLYAGAVPLLLILWGVGQRERSRTERRWFVACCVVAGLALLYAMGQHVPLNRVQAYLPVLSKFRFPCRAIAVVHLAIAMAAAMAAKWLLTRETDKGTPDNANHGALPAYATVMIACTVAVYGALRFPKQLNGMALVLYGPAAFALAAVLLRATARGSRPCAVALLMFGIVDLAGYGMSYPASRQTARLQDMVASPQVATDGRVCNELPGSTKRVGNAVTLSGARLIDGYAGLEPARRLDYTSPKALQAAGVAYVRTPSDREASSWEATETPLDAVRLFSQALVSTNEARDLERIDLQQTVLVDRPVKLSGGEVGTVEVLERRPGLFRVRAECQGRQLLFIQEAYHTGWTATVNGVEQPTVRAHGDFIGCAVEDGRSEVELRFRPRSLLLGRWISGGGLVLLMALAAFCAWPSRPMPSHPVAT